MKRALWTFFSLSVLFFFFSCLAYPQTANPPAETLGQPANTDGTYAALRHVHIGQESTVAENIVFKREFAAFTLKSGTLFYLAPVNGKVTGAVFIGTGTVTIAPLLDYEKRNIALLSGSGQLEEAFNEAIFRFTDQTYSELRNAGPAGHVSDTGRADKLLSDHIEYLRTSRDLRYNISARVLQDVLSPTPDGMFAAFIHGSHFSSHELFAVDPQGLSALGIAPEEVAFAIYDQGKFGIWAASHLEKEYASGDAKGTQMNAPIDVQKQVIDATMEKNGNLRAKVTTTFTAVRPGLRVVPFNLFRNFRVQSVTSAEGQPLPYILEQTNYDPTLSDDPDNFNVILPKPVAAGEQYSITTVYGGKEAVLNEGSGNYFPVSRDAWYPSGRLGDYVTFEMKFHIPKGMRIAATGTMMKETTEGDQYVSEWRSDGGNWVCGFNFGKFKRMEKKLPNGFLVQSYANEEQPDWVAGLKNAVNMRSFRTGGISGLALGSMSSTDMMDVPLAEAEIAIRIYSEYFGATSFKQLAMTQQSACNFGQSWPELVWLPICSYFDSTVRHQLGIDDTKQAYWNVVAPHEVAHQWWGHTVGWASYRDQWMSEGFAQLSASIFLQSVNKDNGMYRKFWRQLQQSVVEKNNFGYRSIDVAPVTLGYRANNAKTGFNHYRDLAYSKGGIVLHMLRMMMWTRKDGDGLFKEMMRDFVASYRGRAASTEDFKAIVEKHMTPQMDLDHNHRMDWFFNEFVYGTALPRYEFSGTVLNTPEGVVLDVKTIQSGVSDNFKMLVPLYLELANGSVVKLGSVTMKGNSTGQDKLKLGIINPPPKRVMINYNYDVLSIY